MTEASCPPGSLANSCAVRQRAKRGPNRVSAQLGLGQPAVLSRFRGTPDVSGSCVGTARDPGDQFRNRRRTCVPAVAWSSRGPQLRGRDLQPIYDTVAHSTDAGHALRRSVGEGVRPMRAPAHTALAAFSLRSHSIIPIRHAPCHARAR